MNTTEECAWVQYNPAFVMFSVRQLSFLIALVFCGTGLSQEAGSIQNKLAALVAASPVLSRAHIGWQFVDAETGTVLAESNALQFFTPASNAKLYTTAAALVRLGVAYQFKTVVRTSGSIDGNGVLTGDLDFIGGGDPNLSGRTLPYSVSEHEEDALAAVKRLADQIQARGIKQVRGDVIGDDTRYPFEPYPDGWAIDDAMWYYGAPVSALTVNDSSARVTVRPTAVGEAPDVRLDPDFGYFVVLNTAETDGGSESHIDVSRSPGSNELVISGTIGRKIPKTEEFVAVDDSALFAAEALKMQLEERGIAVLGQARAKHRPLTSVANPLEAPRIVSTPEGVELATLGSVPLYQAVRVVNKVSQNLHAEMLLREIGFATRGVGTLAAGLDERKKFLTEAGVGDGSLDFADGSGLARQDLTTPATTVQLLRYMWQHPERDSWLASLPIGGLDGTLKKKFKDMPGAERIHAKTGSLRHVSTLSGYMQAKSGHWIVFSLMMNGDVNDKGDVQNFQRQACALFLD